MGHSIYSGVFFKVLFNGLNARLNYAPLRNSRWVISKHFSMNSRPNRVSTPLKRLIERFVPTSKIVVWGMRCLNRSRHIAFVRSSFWIDSCVIVLRCVIRCVLCLPNEDFGTSKNRLVIHSVGTFHTKRDEKCVKNVLPTYFSTFNNLRLGAIQSHDWIFFDVPTSFQATRVLDCRYIASWATTDNSVEKESPNVSFHLRLGSVTKFQKRRAGLWIVMCWHIVANMCDTCTKAFTITSKRIFWVVWMQALT